MIIQDNSMLTKICNMLSIDEHDLNYLSIQPIRNGKQIADAGDCVKLMRVNRHVNNEKTRSKL